MILKMEVFFQNYTQKILNKVYEALNLIFFLFCTQTFELTNFRVLISIIATVLK